MGKNYKHQDRPKRRAELGKAINAVFKLSQQKYRQGVDPNTGKRTQK